jgi:Sigma-70 region 2
MAGNNQFTQASRPDETYQEACAAYGAALSRLAGAYEAEPDKRGDLLQEIHIAMWKSLGRFNGSCSLRTWVFRIAHNVAALHVVRERRQNRIKMVGLEELDAALWARLLISACLLPVILWMPPLRVIMIALWVLLVPYWVYEGMETARRSQRELRAPRMPHLLLEQLYARLMAMRARQFCIAGDQRRIENFRKHYIGCIVRRDRVAQRPNSLQELPVLRALDI